MAADIYARIGAAIRARRAVVGLTQAMLAGETGLSRSSITNIENGGQAILLHQLIDVARALRTDPCELLIAGVGDGTHEVKNEARIGDGRATALLSRLTPVGGSGSR